MTKNTNKKINEKFRLDREELEDKIGIKLSRNSCFDTIVPPRDIKEIEDVLLLEKKVLTAIIKNVVIKGTEEKPYYDSCIKMYRLSPEALKIGQSFVLKEKILALCEFKDLFTNFAMPGINKLPPLIVCGKNSKGLNCAGIYCPPIVEKHKQEMILLDGIHRSYLTMSAGTTMTYIEIQSPSKKLPFEAQEWNYAKLSDTRPEIEKRYIGLDMTLFRDLGAVGIDG